jgi:hypothetical protein
MILRHWKSFQDLKLMFTDSHRAEQLKLHSQQRIVTTVEDSVLRTEMTGLESQEEDAPNRILFFKTMSWLGPIRSHRRDETWSDSLWQTFFSSSIGDQIPVITEKPIATCGCRKFQLDPLGDHLNTATTIWSSGSSQGDAQSSHTWMCPIAASSSLFNIVFQTFLLAFSQLFLSPICIFVPILGVSPSKGPQVPFTTPLHISRVLD